MRVFFPRATSEGFLGLPPGPSYASLPAAGGLPVGCRRAAGGLPVSRKARKTKGKAWLMARPKGAHGLVPRPSQWPMAWPLPWPMAWPMAPGQGPRLRSRVHALMFPKATSEGFLLSMSSTGSELLVLAGCRWTARALPAGCRRIEKQRKPEENRCFL